MARQFCTTVLSLILILLTVSTILAQEYSIQQVPNGYSIREAPSNPRLSVTVTRTGTGDGRVRLRMIPTPVGSLGTDSSNERYRQATSEDYDTTDIELTFAGSQSQQIGEIMIENDEEYEAPGEQFTIVLSLLDTAGTISNSGESVVATILDDDSIFFIEEREVNEHESNGKITFNVLRMGYLPTPSQVTFTTNEQLGGATAGMDYMSVTQVIQLPTNIDRRTVDIPIEQDSVMEEDEAFLVELSNPQGTLDLARSRSIGVILNDDGVYSLTAASTNVRESDNFAEVCVERSAGTITQNTNVVLTTFDAGGSSRATSNSDYTPLSTNSATLTFTPTSSNIQCVNINIMQDTLVEETETFTVQISPDSSYTVGAIGSAEVNIADDDAVYRFQQDRRTVMENTNTFSVVVERIGYVVNSGTVRVRSSSGSATVGVDVTTVNSIQNFPGSSTGQTQTTTLTVRITNDMIDEADEVFYLDLESPTPIQGSSIGTPSRMTITIRDDDAAVATPAPGNNAGGSSSGLSGSQIAGISAGTILGLSLLASIPICCCCFMGCPCMSMFAGAGRRQQVYVEAPPPPPPVTVVQAPRQMIQATPMLTQQAFRVDMLEVEKVVGYRYM